jgi:hypothetical protein
MKLDPSRLATATSRKIRSVLDRPSSAKDGRQNVTFLHIGKAAGTQIAYVSEQINAASDRYRVTKATHSLKLDKLPPDHLYFFAIRSPASRFRSGFYSRKRKGQPRIYSEWSEHERIAFAQFEHANDLAEALFEDGDLGAKALCAMKSISHVSMNQIDWFDRCGNFFEVRPPLMIIRQEHLEKDLGMLMKRLDLDQPPQLTSDPKLAHSNDYTGTPPLSEKAKANLAAWYRQDAEFYRVCEHWLRTSGLASEITSDGGP